MAARALWKAQLQLEKVSLPVRLYSAAQDRNVHFHMLHAEDHQRIQERMRRASDGEVVDSHGARTGYATDTGEIVLLEPKERTALAPKPSRDIRVLHCAPRTVLPMAAFARPYWLGPDGKGETIERYFALADALGDRLAICEWVLRGKHHHGALTARDGYLMLVELHSADEWSDVDALELPSAGQFDARELALAEQLIHGLEAAFDHASFHDEYRERVHELIELKARGKSVPRAAAPKAAPRTKSLLEALSSSVKGLARAPAADSGKKPAAKSASKRQTAKRPRRAKPAQPRRRSREQQHA